MNASKRMPRSCSSSEEILKERLQMIFLREEWKLYRDPIRKITAELQLDLLDCAAAIACLAMDGQAVTVPPIGKPLTAELKMVRYRLEVGRKHQANEDSIKKLLIEESGVENRLIGRIDIHSDYTIIQLPDGMPGEVYQHLKSVQLNRQTLCIKRLDGNLRDSAKNPRNFRRRKRSQAQAHKDQSSRQERRDINLKQKD